MTRYPVAGSYEKFNSESTIFFIFSPSETEEYSTRKSGENGSSAVLTRICKRRGERERESGGSSRIHELAKKGTSVSGGWRGEREEEREVEREFVREGERERERARERERRERESACVRAHIG